MNHSVTQKVLLVIVLVIVISSGILVQSGMGTAYMPAAANASTSTGGRAGTGMMSTYLQVSSSPNCPYHAGQIH